MTALELINVAVRQQTRPTPERKGHRERLPTDRARGGRWICAICGVASGSAKLRTYGAGHDAAVLHDRALEPQLGGFVALLLESHVERVVDVRKIPKSRAHFQFNQATLSAAWEEFHVSNEHNIALADDGRWLEVCRAR